MESQQSETGDAFIVLGQLLKLPRDIEDIGRISEVSLANLSVEEKIAAIRRIDRAAKMRKVRARLLSLLKTSTDPRFKQIAGHVENGIAATVIDDTGTMQRSALIIDDLTYITRTVSQLLGKEGFVVECAKNTVEGLIQFQRMLPNLVITDIRLPDFNGFEAATLMRELDEDVPFVFITAVDVDRKSFDEVRGRKKLLLKPIRREVLMAAIEELLEPQ